MKVAVLGLGRVGAVAAACLAEAGHRVLGIDVDPRRVRSLQKGRADFFEPGLDQLLRVVLAAGALSLKRLDEMDRLDAEVTLIAVGTPSLPSGGPDLSSVRAALGWLVERALRPPLVLMKSTLPPGTGQSLRDQYRLRYVANPEFLREGQAVHDWRQPDRIVLGGGDRRDIRLAQQLYANLEAPFVITDIATAEMIKYAANAFLCTKISFINEIANLCDHLGADIDDVVAGIALDPRIGPSFLRAGIGYGGPCFPKDVRALGYLSALNGYSCDLLRATISVNNHQRLLPIQALRQGLGVLSGREIAILGLAFKPDTDDIREGPALEIVRLLLAEGARVRAYDPMVRKGEALPEGAVMAPSAQEALAGAQALVLCTEWEEFSRLDWESIRHTMLPPYLVFDGRNALRPEGLRRLGYHYVGVGRGRGRNEKAAGGHRRDWAWSAGLGRLVE